jgi:FtsH-binding integral membrane protein
MKFFFGFDSNSIIYSTVSFISICGYLVYDVQMILGNKSRKYSIDNYVMASLVIYQDLVHLFIKIARFLEKIN